MFRSLTYLAAVAAAGVLAAPADSSGAGLAVRNAPGMSTSETLHELRRHLIQARSMGAEYLLDESFPINHRVSQVAILKIGTPGGEEGTEEETKEEEEGETKPDDAPAKEDTGPGENAPEKGDTIDFDGQLSHEAGLEVFCNDCYVVATAVAQFSISNGSFELSSIVDGVVDEFKETVDEIIDYASDYAKDVFRNIRDGESPSEFDLPPLDIPLNIELPELPECRLRLGFEELELFMDLRTTLTAGATYSMRLYTSNGVTGFEVTDSLRLGVVFNLDLVLSVSGILQISHGFHLRFDEGLFLELNLFATEVSKIEHNGARFEFLPVQIDTGEVILDALLRFSIFSGITLKTPSRLSEIELGPLSIPKAGGGIEASLYADLAQLKTNLTAAVDDDMEDCLVQVVQDFSVAVGAAAGATVFINERTWGPTPSTHTPVFYTTLAKVCALSSETTPAPEIRGRQDDNDDEEGEELSTTSTESKIVYTGVQCLSAGLIDCPASLQSVHKYTVTETLSTAVPSGVDVNWDDRVEALVQTPHSFGDDVRSVEATSGQPVSFVPPPPPATSSAEPEEDDEDVDSEGNSKSGNQKGSEDGEEGSEGSGGPNLPLILGLSLGLGIPALLAIIGAVIFFVRRQKLQTAGGSTVAYEKVQKGTTAVETGKVPAVSEISRGTDGRYDSSSN